MEKEEIYNIDEQSPDVGPPPLMIIVQGGKKVHFSLYLIIFRQENQH